jgi:hypothetical protein
MSLPWRPRQRRALLDRYFALLPRAEEDAEVSSELSAIADQYRQGLPKLMLSRCPFTKFEQRHTFDPYGLDGLWWNYQDPARPLRERIYTCQAITGAVTISKPVENFPFLAKPGPAIPYVIPHCLEPPDVTAVLSSLPCGRHTAYCIAYFAPNEKNGVDWPNDWGANERWAEGGNSPGGWYEAPDFEELWDFDLRPWIDSGKLLWIAPDDENLELRSGTAGCPYLDLDGERRMQYVSGGEVWTSGDLDENELEETES